MYEALIKRLQDFAAGTERDKDAQLAFDAADAIEKLCSFIGAEDAERMAAYPPKEET